MLREIEFGSLALEYLRNELGQGDDLSNLLLSLPLNSGRITSYLPEPLRVAETIDFDRSVFLTAGIPMTGVTSNLVELASGYLAGGTGRYFVLETFHRSDDRLLDTKDLDYFTFKTRVYEFFNSERLNTSRIAMCVRRAREYPFVGILTAPLFEAAEIGNRQEVTEHVLRCLVDGTELIAVGAFDGEGYLIWKRIGSG